MGNLSLNPDMLVRDQVSAVLDSPAKFSRWWDNRADHYDRKIVAEAERRNLITRGGGLIVLTTVGKALRAAGSKQR